MKKQLVMTAFILGGAAVTGFGIPPVAYGDGRPVAILRVEAKDQGVVFEHGDGPGQCDMLGARDVWIYEADGTYYMHYDGAGPKGWLACLATSTNLVNWTKKGPVLDFGKAGEDDSASASYGVTCFDGKTWHMFYLGTPHVSPAPDLIPSFPYLTMKARSTSPAGPWIKQKDVIPFRTKPNTYYADTASPGHVIQQGKEYLMFFSASMKRTLGIARTKDLNGPWTIGPQPIVSPEEQIENSSLYFEPVNKTWFLFTNHIGVNHRNEEYTDAGYGFDGCSPKILMARAEVKDGLITFPGGSSYRLMVLPQIETMTPGLLAKIRDLVKAGATIVGTPPVKSPSLSGYPACDAEVKALAKDMWGCLDAPKTATKRSYGKGVIHWGGDSSVTPPLYPSYDLTAALLRGMGVPEDFTATGPVRYGHRRAGDRDIYFVANRTANPIKADCRFRVGKGSAQLWDPVTGEQRPLLQFERADGLTVIPMEFDAFQSFFVVFGNETGTSKLETGSSVKKNFPELQPAQELTGSWTVTFDPKWGGPRGAVISNQSSVISDQFSNSGGVTFDKLISWTERPEPGIKYYSGIATYRKEFSYQSSVVSNQLSVNSSQLSDLRSPITDHFRIYLDLGVVHDMARVRLNGKDLGVVWCAPWRVDVTGAIKSGDNQIEIEVVNRWANRLIGDKQPADAHVRTVECPPGFLGGQQVKAGRYTYSLHDPYNAQSPLIPSGLLGPVTLLTVAHQCANSICSRQANETPSL